MAEPRVRIPADGVVYMTRDRKYGVLELHATRADAERERARDPALIDVVEFVEKRSTERG